MLDRMDAFGYTGFREDLVGVDVPTRVNHGDSEAIAPLEVSGRRTHEAVPGSSLALS